MKNHLGWLWALLLLLSGPISVWAQTPNGVDAQNGQETKPHRQDGYFFTNPLLDCEPPLNYLAPFRNDLHAFIEEQLAQENASRISVYFRQLNNGYSFGIKEHAMFNPASLLKVADMVHILKMAEKDPTILTDTIELERLHQPEENVTNLVVGNRYTVKQLIFHMIAYSDNEAKNLLQERFGDKYMWKKVLSDLGITVKTGAAYPNILSAKSYSILFSVLYHGSYLNRKMSRMALNFLSQSTFDEGIVAGIGDNSVQVANKFGLRNRLDGFQLHDCAIVYVSGNPYLLVVMTEGKTVDNLYKVIEGVSGIVHKKCTAFMESKDATNIEAGTVKLVSPLIDCSTNLKVLKPFGERVSETVKAIESREPITNVSVYFRHLTTGQTFEVNGQMKYAPASLMKTAHMMAILKGSEDNLGFLDHRLSYDHQTISTLPNIKDQTLTYGETYSVMDLIKRMVIYSDNLSSELLAKNIANDLELWQALFLELGIQHLRLDEPALAQVTPRDMSLLFRVLYNSTYLNRDDSETALGILSRTRFQSGIRKGVDRNVVVASKFGERCFIGGPETRCELHDIGIVYFEGNPYLLCVMTRGSDLEEQAKAVAEISKTVYLEMKRQFPTEGPLLHD